MIRLTENAIEYLNSIKKDDYVTLGVQGGGCMVSHMCGII